MPAGDSDDVIHLANRPVWQQRCSSSDPGWQMLKWLLVCASYMRSKLVALAMPPAGLTARLLSFTVDGLTCVASKVVLDASRRGQRLATWSLGARIVATAGANPPPGTAKNSGLR